MADETLQALIRELRRLVAAKDNCALTNAQLLQRFVESRDEAALEVLVWRHGPLICSWMM